MIRAITYTEQVDYSEVSKELVSTEEYISYIA